MSITAAFGPYLPYLRRYARALAGSQESGDAFVRACLQVLLDAPGTGLDLDRPKVSLYRLFHAVWSSSGARLDGGDGSAILHSIPAGKREALLLTAVEGFSLAEAAEILDAGADAVEADIEAARAAMQAQMRAEVMIIEDEPIIAMHLETLARELDHRVVGVATTHAEATDLARRTEPDLILADIRLADGSSGLEAVREILDEYQMPVVFITAYPERLLTGERPEPTYLVTKPFLPETVKATIGQALFHRLTRRPTDAASAA